MFSLDLQQAGLAALGSDMVKLKHKIQRLIDTDVALNEHAQDPESVNGTLHRQRPKADPKAIGLSRGTIEKALQMEHKALVEAVRNDLISIGDRVEVAIAHLADLQRVGDG